MTAAGGGGMALEVDDGRLGEYRLVARLPRPPAGRVHRAVRDRDASLHVVTVLRDDLAEVAEDEVVELLAGARRLLDLDSPRLVPVHDVVLDAGRAALVTPDVAGDDLRTHLLQHGPLEPALACRLGGQVAMGLAAAHAAGVLHGGLTAQSVLLEPRGNRLRARLAGVGVAGLVRPAGVGAGPRGPAAPEVGVGGPPTPAADVYALGALVLLSVVGHPDRRAADRVGPAHSAEVPDPLRAVLSGALSSRPQDRPDARTLAARLAQLVVDLDADDTEPVAAALPAPRRRLAVAGVGAAAALGLALVLPGGAPAAPGQRAVQAVLSSPAASATASPGGGSPPRPVAAGAGEPLRAPDDRQAGRRAAAAVRSAAAQSDGRAARRDTSAPERSAPAATPSRSGPPRTTGPAARRPTAVPGRPSAPRRPAGPARPAPPDRPVVRPPSAPPPSSVRPPTVRPPVAPPSTQRPPTQRPPTQRPPTVRPPTVRPPTVRPPTASPSTAPPSSAPPASDAPPTEDQPETSGAFPASIPAGG